MSKVPQGQKRPADVICTAVHIVKIATGEIEETSYAQRAKVRSGKGAKACKEIMAAGELRPVAKRAAAGRWG